MNHKEKEIGIGLVGCGFIGRVHYLKPAGFPGPKFSVGWTRYHFASQFDFLRSLSEKDYKPLGATFEDGLRVQAAEKSSKTGGWVNVRQHSE